MNYQFERLCNCCLKHTNVKPIGSIYASYLLVTSLCMAILVKALQCWTGPAELTIAINCPITRAQKLEISTLALSVAQSTVLKKKVLLKVKLEWQFVIYMVMVHETCTCGVFFLSTIALGKPVVVNSCNLYST